MITVVVFGRATIHLKRAQLTSLMILGNRLLSVLVQFSAEFYMGEPWLDSAHTNEWHLGECPRCIQRNAAYYA